MLESGDVLRTWSLGQLPHGLRDVQSRTATMHAACAAVAATNEVGAIKLGDHRLEYLDFEGPLSRERGSVTRVAEGTYRSERESPDCWRIAVEGEALSGTLLFSQPNADSTQWTIEWQPAA
jgi:hypothetical protein